MLPHEFLPDPKRGGLLLPRGARDRPNLRMGIENWIVVERIENASGKVSKRRRFPNLMLNRGLDEHFKSDLLNLGNFGAASEDATAPVVTDTSLGSEVLRSSADGGIAQTTTEIADGHIKVVDTRQLASDGNYNIRKVGFSQSSTPGGTVNAAEQIKDAGGNPDVVTLDTTQSLRMSWERHYYFAPIVATAGNVAVSGFPGQSPDPATRTGQYAFTTYSFEDRDDLLRALSVYLRGAMNLTISFLYVENSAVPLGWNNLSTLSGAVLLENAYSVSASSYVNGNYARFFDVTLKTSQGNIQHDAYVLSPNGHQLYAWNFDAGQQVTKDNLGRVTVKFPQITLARRP